MPMHESRNVGFEHIALLWKLNVKVVSSIHSYADSSGTGTWPHWSVSTVDLHAT